MELSRSRRRQASAAMLILAMNPATLSAQQQRSGPDSTQAGRRQQSALSTGVLHAEAIEQLRRSGMDRSRIRAGLERLGQDPGLTDAYFDVIEGRRPVPDGEAPPAFIEAMNALGIPMVAHADQLRIRSPWVADPAGAIPATTTRASDEPALFGLDLFRRFTTQFDAPLSGPVDPAYRLGAGDELSLILTGEVEFSYAMEVTREGFIVIPDVGQLFVSGLTLAELEDRLFGVLGRHYSGVRRGEGAPIRFHIGLRRLRASAVYVIGEAVRPGAYQVSSVATVLNALYLAGGPAEGASFRSIEVRRGDRVFATLDLYEYLVRGATTGDVRLEHGDVIFLPVSGTRVTVEGAVRRSAIFELRPGDGMGEAIAFAGGLSSDAASHRIQIDRILPLEERRPGVDRVLVDVDGSALARGERVALQDGDVVRVFGVLGERRNRVVLTGEVNRPGVYEWVTGMTLGELLARADGLAERAYVSRTHVYRLNPRNGARHLLRLDESQFDVTPLMDRDSIVIYGVEQLANPRFVSIEGFVKNPGRYALATGMTLQDLILAAGGFVHGAWVVEAELARMSMHADGGPATVSRVRLGGRPDAQSAGVIDWQPDASEVTLEHGDHVFVRKAPEYEVLGTVKVAGEVVFPGAYALTGRSVRVSDILARAGGVEPEAHLGGAQLVRDGHLVATDVVAALREPGTEPDLELFARDSIFVPRLDATVLVRGAVGFETRVRFEAGRSLDHYVERAGGYAENADRGRATLTQQNGARSVVHRRRYFFDSTPEPGPGSTIFVPTRPENRSGGLDWDALLTRVVGMASATATVLIAVDRIR